MNSEMQKQIFEMPDPQQSRKDAEQEREAKTARDADAAVEFNRTEFWQIMKKDLTEARDKIVTIVMTNELLTKEQIDLYRTEAKNIQMFLEHPRKYVQKLQNMLARKRNNGGLKGIFEWLKPQPKK
jgi:hypothetical protein